MIKKTIIQLKSLDIIFLGIICFFLFAILAGPSMINLFIFFLLVYLIYNIKKNLIKIDKNELIIFVFPLIFWIYIVLSSLFMGNFSIGFEKSFFYIRFIILSFIIYKILITKELLLKYFSIIFSSFSIFLSIDILFQYFSGQDLFGYKAGLCVYDMGRYDPELCERFSGFFGEEYIAGSYLSTFGIFFIFILKNYLNKKIYSIFFFIVSLSLIILATIITGERSALLNLILIFTFNLIFNFKIRKYLLYIAIIFVFLSAFAINNFDHVKHRYVDWPINYIKSQDGNFIQKLIQTPWGIHYVTAYEVFKDHYLLGSGFKSYREVCKQQEYETNLIIRNYGIKKETKYTGCSTHPHNIYFELLSETGLFGLILFIISKYYLIFHEVIKKRQNIFKNPYLIFSLSAVCSILFPFKPTGSLSSTVFAGNLWFLIGIFLFFVKKSKN
ncbi:O-antigen ligase family protein [Pelagibacterales bacterium SAG-MED08]|nr:O-antigen ligase family protein [Pelagibacterales bacterium SAG-MED08]